MLALLGLAAACGITAAEAHYEGTEYYNIDVTVVEYERVSYDTFDLVRMKIVIENYEDFDLQYPEIFLGGTRGYAGDAAADPDTEKSYLHVGSADVKELGGDVSSQDCASVDMWNTIPANGLGETSACFMVGKAFEPDGLMVATFDYTDHNVNVEIRWCFGSGDSHSCLTKIQVVPFSDGSVFCFEHNPEYCNAGNVQPVSDGYEYRPATEPERPVHAALLYTIYNNGTGTLTLVFDRLVVAHDPDRISLIHDIATYIEDGAAPGLSGAELSTVDNKRQSQILAFALGDELRQEVAASLRTHGDLALVIDSRAIYAADGFVDVAAYHENGAILVTDVVVVR